MSTYADRLRITGETIQSKSFILRNDQGQYFGGGGIGYASVLDKPDFISLSEMNLLHLKLKKR